MRTWTNFTGRFGENWALAGRLIVATMMFYVVALLYNGTIGKTGVDVLVAPAIATAVFAGVITLPLAAAWYLSRRTSRVG